MAIVPQAEPASTWGRGHRGSHGEAGTCGSSELEAAGDFSAAMSRLEFEQVAVWGSVRTGKVGSGGLGPQSGSRAGQQCWDLGCI